VYTWQFGRPSRGASPGATGQDEEGGLEGVLDVLFLPQQVTADAPDQPAVPLHQRRERRLLAAVAELLQQLAV
jgi:hypothetical protein